MRQKGIKMTLQQQREFYAAFFGEEPCPANNELTAKELDEAIADCQDMLQYSIDHNNKEEISFWRKLLQENKVQRRLLTT